MDQNQLYDVQTIEVMRRVLGDNSSAVDVGCHRGSMLREILKLAPSGKHIAIEPLPDMFKLLEADFGGDARVELHNVALSDISGFVRFQHVISNPGYSGLRRRRYDRDDETIVEIDVQTERLDGIVDKGMDIRFIKIDVEGAEYQVLTGAAETLRRCAPTVVFEHGLGGADEYGISPEEVFDLLEGCGLRCFTMAGWLTSYGNENLSREAFSQDFRSGRNYYFLAAK